MVSSSCQFKKPVAYPEDLEAGLRVLKTGTKSVTYEVAIFREGETDAAAVGEMVHVFVDRASNKSAPIPTGILKALDRISANTN